jgi:hypothetical protein
MKRSQKKHENLPDHGMFNNELCEFKPNIFSNAGHFFIISKKGVPEGTPF